MPRVTLRVLVVTVVAVMGLALTDDSIVAAQTAVGPDPVALEQTVSKAVAFLKAQGQSEDGSFSGVAGPGVTALVTTSLLRNGLSPEDPTVVKSLRYLEGFVRPDGGVYQEGTLYRNYETCLAILCFTEANRNGRYDELLDHAEKFVKGLQWNEDESHDQSSASFGGAGYGKHRRPDMSNTNFLIEALRATGNGPEDKAMRDALIFVSRCQNLETEHNLTKFSAKNPDGGFYYTIAAGGSSQAGPTPQGGLRSYGSMTYAGLKSMIYAGVGPEDERVKAAYKWIQQNFSLTENPGMGTAGLYYYYHTFAKALDAVGDDKISAADGRLHDWRSELAATLAANQQPNGSWVNENNRWFEGDPNLVTGYALLALSYCRTSAEQQ